MNVLITGSSGMLGKDIVEVLSKTVKFNVFGIDKIAAPDFAGNSQIIGDLLDTGFLNEALNSINPDIIIHCAAFVNLDFCEDNKEITEKLHCGVTAHLSSFNALRSRFIYISTDSVFSGEKGSYDESDIPAPRNFYAQSKYKGELMAQENNPQALIIRTNIYGFKHPPGNSLVEWALEKFKKDETVSGFKDIFFNPLYTKQLARIIASFIINKEVAGIIHAGSSRCISKYFFLRKLAQTFKYSPELVTESSSWQINFRTPRPRNTSLDITKLQKVITEIPDLGTGLQELYSDYYKQTKT